ncbi:MAG: hypothetical protein U0176_26165 [Bacteroidia bacterium]
MDRWASSSVQGQGYLEVTASSRSWIGLSWLGIPLAIPSIHCRRRFPCFTPIPPRFDGGIGWDLLAAIAFVVFFDLGRKRWPYWAFGGAFFRILYSSCSSGAGMPTWLIDSATAVHRITFGSGDAGQIWSEGGALKWIPIVGLAGLSLWFIVRTQASTAAWKDSNSIWNHTIALYPGRLPLAYANRVK